MDSPTPAGQFRPVQREKAKSQFHIDSCHLRNPGTMVLGWPHKDQGMQSLGSERGGPTLPRADLSRNKDRED